MHLQIYIVYRLFRKLRRYGAGQQLMRTLIKHFISFIQDLEQGLPCDISPLT